MVKKTQDPVERVHQLIYNTLVTKNLSNKVFDYKYPWRETLSSIEYVIRVSCCCTVGTIPSQAVFGRYMISNLVSVFYWIVITTK